MRMCCDLWDSFTGYTTKSILLPHYKYSSIGFFGKILWICPLEFFEGLRFFETFAIACFYTGGK